MESEEDKRKYYNKVFDSADLNKDGRITIKELKKFLREKCKENISERDVAKIFCDLDIDGDGEITRLEFLTEMMKLDPKDSRQRYEECFRRWDKNADGKLSKEEIKAASSEIGIFSEQEIDLMIEKIDRNKDGFIDWEEFLCALCLDE